MAANKPRFTVTALAGVVTQAIGMCLSLGWVFLATRSLDIASAGRLFVGISVANTAVAVFSFGLPHAFAVAGRDMGDRALASNAVLATICMGILAALVVLPIGLVAMDGPDYVIGGWRILPLMTFAVFVNTLSVTILRALTAYASSNVSVLLLLAMFNAELLLSWLQGERLSTAQVLLMYLQAAALSALASLVMVLLRGGFALRTVRLRALKSMFTFGAGVQLGTALKEAMYRSSLYLVSWLLGPVAAGLYGLVLRLIEAASRFVDGIGLVLVPMIARGEETERKAIIYLAMSVAVPGMILAAAPISLFSEWLVVTVFGAEYRGAAELLRVGIFAIVPLSAWKLLANDLIARTMLRPFILSAAAGAASVIVLNLVLLPIFGVVAAPYVLLGSYLLAAGLLVRVALVQLRYSPSRMLLHAPRQALTRVGRGRR